MHRLIGAFLGAVLLACPWAPATAQMMLTGAGKVTVGGGGGFTGVGDLSLGATWKAWYGLRAFSSATRGAAVINACNSTGGTDVGCADMLTDATTGNLVSATVGGITCPGANCTVKIWYDKSGSGFNVTQNTIASRDSLVANCIGSLPCAVHTNGTSVEASATSLSIATNPVSFSHVWKYSAGSSDFGDLIATGGSTTGLAMVAFNTGFKLIQGNSATIACNQTRTVSTNYVGQGVFNGTGTSFTELNGTDVTCSGFTAQAATWQIGIGSGIDAGMPGAVGAGAYNYYEMGILQGALASGGGSNSACVLSQNQGTYWGITVTC